MRYCFDYYRPITGISKIIDSYVNKQRVHTTGTLAEVMLYSGTFNKKITWNRKPGGEFRFMFPMEDTRALLEKAMDNEEYRDSHNWCFTPHSFRLIIHDLNCLGLINLKEVSFVPTGGFEFFIFLGRNGSGPQLNRLQMLNKVRQEVSKGATFNFFGKVANFLRTRI